MSASARLRRIRRATASTAGVTAVVLALAMPAGAAARPGDEVRPRSLHLTMSAAGTRGYEVTVDTLGHHRVTLTVAKNGQLASYMTRGKVSRHRVKADFGRFGKVALRFHGKRRAFPARPQRRSKPRAKRTVCRGRSPQREVGRFRGTIEFDGQNGYTRLAVGRLRGEVRRSYRQVCRLVPAKPKHGDRRARPAVASSVPSPPAREPKARLPALPRSPSKPRAGCRSPAATSSPSSLPRARNGWAGCGSSALLFRWRRQDGSGSAAVALSRRRRALPSPRPSAVALTTGPPRTRPPPGPGRSACACSAAASSLSPVLTSTPSSAASAPSTRVSPASVGRKPERRGPRII
jgi:hypothetical protein